MEIFPSQPVALLTWESVSSYWRWKHPTIWSRLVQGWPIIPVGTVIVVTSTPQIFQMPLWAALRTYFVDLFWIVSLFGIFALAVFLAPRFFLSEESREKWLCSIVVGLYKDAVRDGLGRGSKSLTYKEIRSCRITKESWEGESFYVLQFNIKKSWVGDFRKGIEFAAPISINVRSIIDILRSKNITSVEIGPNVSQA